MWLKCQYVITRCIGCAGDIFWMRQSKITGALFKMYRAWKNSTGGLYPFSTGEGRQPNFTPKTTGKRRTKTPKIRRKEIIKIWAEINEKERKETIVKITKSQSWFFEKINKIDKPLARFKKKGGKNQINKVRNEQGEVTTDNAEILRIIRDYYEQLYGHIWMFWWFSLLSSI